MMPMGPPYCRRRSRRCCKCVCIFILVIACAVLLGRLAWHKLKPQYSVAITAVTGLDPSTDLGQCKLGLEFNLTLRIASGNPFGPACFQPGSTVEVHYHGVQLAHATAPQMCAVSDAMGHKGTVQGSVVASGTGVCLTGAVLDILKADMRRLAVAFDVTVTIPLPAGDSNHGGMKLVSCRARWVGDYDALWSPCDLYSSAR